MGRPSPRTQGIDEEGETFQKFGTQQLIKNPKSVTGVSQVNTGKGWKGFTTSGYTGTKTTVFSERIQAGITGAVPVELHDEAVQRQKEKLEEMGIPQIQFPDLFGDLFKPKDTGCECEACKNGTGQCSEKVPQCDAWDIGCEVTGGITNPIGSWWEKYGIWVYLILGVIGLGVLLWLLRPLFGVAKNVTGITKSAVTRVNGMK